MRGRHFNPSDVVPLPQDDVFSPTNVSVFDFVASVTVASLFGSPFPLLGWDSVPAHGRFNHLL